MDICAVSITPITIKGFAPSDTGRKGSINKDAYIYSSATIFAPWNLKVGRVCIGPNTILYNKDLIVIMFLLFYITLTNFSASILRTIIFFIILKLNKKLDLNISTKNALLITLSIIMIYNPLIVFDIGFQYSGLVTFGLIVSTKYYKIYL